MTKQTRAIALVAERIRSNQQQLAQSEQKTRTDLINPILDAYGWKLNDSHQVRMEQGSAQPGRPDISLIDPDRGIPVAPLEAKKLASPEMQRALRQAQEYTDGGGKTAKVVITTDGDRWIFQRPGQADTEKPLASVQISQDKPEDAARTLTRVLRPRSIITGKMDKELDKAEAAPSAAPDRRINTYTVLDLETTGFGNNDKIIEVGAVKVRDGQETDSMQTFVNPGRPIPAPVRELTGITDKDVKDAPFFDRIKARLQQFIGNDPAIAHNAAFDRRMLEAHGVNTENTDWYDTMKLSRRIDQDQKEHNLEAITRRLGIDTPGPHRADVDARITAKAFNALMDKAEDLPADKRRSLIRETSRRGQNPEGALLAASASKTPRPKAYRQPNLAAQRRQSTNRSVKSSKRRPILTK